MRKILGVTVHHSALGADLPLERVRASHVARGWGNVGYHYYLRPSGACEAGRPISEVGAHCHHGRRNHDFAGICLAGNFDEYPPTLEQLSQLVETICMIFAEHGRGLIEGHRDVPGARTACPGRYLHGRIEWVKQRVDLLLPRCISF